MKKSTHRRPVTSMGNVLTVELTPDDVNILRTLAHDAEIVHSPEGTNGLADIVLAMTEGIDLKKPEDLLKEIDEINVEKGFVAVAHESDEPKRKGSDLQHDSE